MQHALKLMDVTQEQLGIIVFLSSQSKQQNESCLTAVSFIFGNETLWVHGADLICEEVSVFRRRSVLRAAWEMNPHTAALPQAGRNMIPYPSQRRSITLQHSHVSYLHEAHIQG